LSEGLLEMIAKGLGMTHRSRMNTITLLGGVYRWRLRRTLDKQIDLRAALMAKL